MGDAPKESDWDGVGCCVAEAVRGCDGLGVALGETEAEGACEGLPEPDGDREGVPVSDAAAGRGLGDRLGDCDAVLAPRSITHGCTVAATKAPPPEDTAKV